MNQNVCRCCLKENPTITYKIFDESGNVWEELKECLPSSLNCEYQDGLPQIICDTCCLQVQHFKEFRQQCLLADQELKNRYADYKNQAVEEVLGLIEKLRQEDNNLSNNWQTAEDLCDFYEETQDLNDMSKYFLKFS